MNCSDGVLDGTVVQRLQRAPTPAMFIASSTNALKNLEFAGRRLQTAAQRSRVQMRLTAMARQRTMVRPLVCCTRALHSQIPLARRRITASRGAQRARASGR
jgi:hypothetical protein